MKVIIFERSSFLHRKLLNSKPENTLKFLKLNITLDRINRTDLIHQAETLITEENYTEAAKTYDKAYQVNSYMFAIDIENALICNIQNKDWEKSALLAEKLMLKGVEMTFFNSQRFNSLKKTKEWEKLLKRQNEIHSEFQKGLNQTLVDSLVVLMEYDQSEYIKLKGTKTMDDMTEVTSDINARLIRLIDKYGFPSEEKIGIYIYNDTILSGNAALDFDVLFRHSNGVSSNTSQPDLLDPIAKKGINDVLLRINVYEDFMVGRQLTFILVGDKIYENSWFEKPEDKEKTDLLRKKIVFKNTKNKAGFNFYTPLAIIGGPELEEQEWFMKDHAFLVKYKE